MTKRTKKKVEVRKFVETFLDAVLKEDILSQISWVTFAYPLSDVRDVALGFIIGLTLGKYEGHCYLDELLDGSELTVKDIDVVMEVFHEKLPEIIDKIEKEFCT